MCCVNVEVIVQLPNVTAMLAPSLSFKKTKLFENSISFEIIWTTHENGLKVANKRLQI